MALPVEEHRRRPQHLHRARRSIDAVTVRQNVLAPNNIAAHVGQNAVNYFASTFAWFLLVISAPSDLENARSLDDNGNEEPPFNLAE